MVKAGLMKSQTETRNMLFNNGEKAIFVISVAQNSIDLGSHSSVFVEGRTWDEIGYFTEEISKQNVDSS